MKELIETGITKENGEFNIKYIQIKGFSINA